MPLSIQLRNIALRSNTTPLSLTLRNIALRK